MADHVAQRTLVKSPPELWAEVSEERTLSGRLVAFGEIRITRLEPETSVAWEGQDIRGTVELEPAGWGTLVTLTADAVLPPGEPEPEPAEDLPRGGWFARFFARRRRDPLPAAEAPVEPAPVPCEPDPTALLSAVLDDLGAAHHRPFSRS